MWDALLYAWRDGLLNAGYGYDETSVEVRESGMPPPCCGEWFVAVHQGATRQTNDNCKMNWLDPLVTLTKRVNLSDRVGQRDLSRNEVQQLAKKAGFNARLDQLENFFHMAWELLGDANNNLIAWTAPTVGEVYGFSEPARWRTTETPTLVHADWFGGDPDEGNPFVGLKAEIQFADCRRLQPIGEYV